MKKMKTQVITFLIISMSLILFILCISQSKISQSWSKSKMSSLDIDSEDSSNQEKQKGIHVFGIEDTSNLEFLKQNNIEWVTLVSWGFQEDFDSPVVSHHNGDSLMIKKSDANWITVLESVHNKGYKIFFKPHLWLNYPTNGKWRSDIFPICDENWELWKESYRGFILRYATIAEITNVEMFCIGTEFSKLSVEKPEFWRDLIKEVRSVYSGKITYAANWHGEYENIEFWQELDYIGIQAYFPLVKNESPSINEISIGWEKYIPKMEEMYNKYEKNIIFTEMGYKSTTDSAIRPWEWVENATRTTEQHSEKTQANCYEAFFVTVWPKKWFGGVHIWQMRTDDKKRRTKGMDFDFTPLDKLAEMKISEGFSKE